MFEKVERSIEILGRIKRPNFGVIYEPANLDLCGQDYRASAVRRLRRHIFNVYVQNHGVHERGVECVETWCRGPVRFDHVPMSGDDGLDFRQIMSALGQIDHDGFATVCQAFAELSGPAEAARRSAAY